MRRERTPPYKNAFLVVGVLLIPLGIGNWVTGAVQSQPHAEYLRMNPEPKLEHASPQSEILEPPDDKREERDVARAKLEFYQLVQSGGRFMVLLGATCLVAGWAARLIPRYPNLMPTARHGERRPLS
jgi:hypothetical protein